MKPLIGVFLAALALFVWGFLFWATPLTQSVYHQMTDEEGFAQAMREHMPESGTYVMPNAYDGDQERMMAAHRAGPLATVFVRMNGAEPMSVTVFVLGFLHMLVAAFLGLVLLRLALPALGGYGARVGFLFLVGLAGAFWINFSAPIWWYQPWDFHIMSFVYNVVAWLIVGLILGWAVKPQGAPVVTA
jgi:hypothetical protein